MVIAGRKYKLFLWNTRRELRNRDQTNGTRSTLSPGHANLFAGFEPPGCWSEVELVVGYREIYLIEGLAFLRSDNTYTL
jgi:hypothetical protein